MELGSVLNEVSMSRIARQAGKRAKETVKATTKKAGRQQQFIDTITKQIAKLEQRRKSAISLARFARGNKKVRLDSEAVALDDEIRKLQARKERAEATVRGYRKEPEKEEPPVEEPKEEPPKEPTPELKAMMQQIAADAVNQAKAYADKKIAAAVAQARENLKVEPKKEITKEEPTKTAAPEQALDDKIENALTGLKNLGFKAAEVKPTLQDIANKNPDISVADLVQKALSSQA